MVLSQHSDSQLVKSYISGQEAAFEVLLNRHQEAIFKFIYHKLKDSELPNDIFQETFVKVIQKLTLQNMVLAKLQCQLLHQPQQR